MIAWSSFFNGIPQHDFLLQFQTSGQEFNLGDLLDVFGGILSLALSVLTFYTWRRRGHRSLLIISIAFLIYFVRSILDVQPVEGVPIDILSAIFNVSFLILFFVAIATWPSGDRRRNRMSSKSENGESDMESPAP